MNSGQPKKDRTRLLKDFEAEVKASGLKLGATDSVLRETERILCPYFENNNALRTALRLGALTYEGAFLSRKASTPWVEDCVKTLLSEFRASRKAHPSDCYARWSRMRETTNRAIINGATTAQLQTRYADVDTDLFVRALFRDMADILEGSLQPFLRLRLAMIEVGGGRKKRHKDVDELAFGDVVAELIDFAKGHLYQPPPIGLVLSQWRNIANHHSYESTGNRIKCSYGPPNKRKSFECSRDDLLNLAQYVGDLSFAHKVAVEIFAIDNLHHIYRPTAQFQISEFTKESVLAHGLATGGFSIREALFDGRVWELTLFDERGRNEFRAKEALQEACAGYALIAEGCHIEALVRSMNTTYKFGFKTTLQAREQPIPDNFRGSIRQFGNDFRLGPELR